MASMNDGGVAFAKENDEIYAVVSGTLCAWRDGAWTKIRAVSASRGDFYFGVMGQYYITVSQQGLHATMLIHSEEAVLSIKGVMTLDEMDAAFMEENPNIIVSRTAETHHCAQEIFQAVQSGDTIDLFLIPLSASVEQLIQKGYIAPLDSDVLAKEQETLYPSVALPLAAEGRVYAVPESIYVLGWQQSTDRVGDREVPKTLQELLTQQSAWQEDSENGGIPICINRLWHRGMVLR